MHNQKLKAKRLRSKRLRQDNSGTNFEVDHDAIQDVLDATMDANIAEQMNDVFSQIDVDFYADAFYGVIDGMSSVFTNEVCQSGMVSVVDTLKQMLDNREVYKPENVMKFSIASNNFQEAQNTVVAYCDFSSYGRSLSKLTETSKWENYIRFAGRVGGVFINDWQPNYECITNSISVQIGHDAGICASTLLSQVLDAVL
jgi:hypothetical protein